MLAVGMVLFGRLDAQSGYLSDVLPGVLLFGAGLVFLVAPVTATVLAAADDARAGVASGINNAVARTAGLLAVAILPVAAGLGTDGLNSADALLTGFGRAMAIASVLAIAGAGLAFFGLPGSLSVSRRQVAQPEAHEHPHVSVECPAPARRDLIRSRPSD